MAKKTERQPGDIYSKCIRGEINGRYTFSRIPIKRRTPEEILYHRPITDAEDFERRIKLIVDWFRGFEHTHNIVIQLFALTDEEADELEASGDFDSLTQMLGNE